MKGPQYLCADLILKNLPPDRFATAFFFSAKCSLKATIRRLDFARNRFHFDECLKTRDQSASKVNPIKRDEKNRRKCRYIKPRTLVWFFRSHRSLYLYDVLYLDSYNPCYQKYMCRYCKITGKAMAVKKKLQQSFFLFFLFFLKNIHLEFYFFPEAITQEAPLIILSYEEKNIWYSVIFFVIKHENIAIITM